MLRRVVLDGARAYVQDAADFNLGLAARHEVHDPRLALGEKARPTAI